MKRLFFHLLPLAGIVSAVLAVAGCAGAPFYENVSNWVIRDSATPAYSIDFDVFYLYPSQVKKTVGETYNWMHGNQFEHTYRYVKTHSADQVQLTGRVFSPFVPQLGYDRFMELLKKRQANVRKFDSSRSPLAPAVKHTVMALEYYLNNYNRDARPFVLIGQGQGALTLYEAMKECSRIKPKNGFVAAYLLGLPGITAEQIRRDFGSRRIVPASDRYGAGVIVICNARLPGQPDPNGFFNPKDFVINPLNWRTDAVPAPPALNRGAVFYAKTAKTASMKTQVIPHFCGAVIDTRKGGLILTNIDPKTKMFLSEYGFSSDIWGIFMRNICFNARERSIEFIFERDLESAR